MSAGPSTQIEKLVDANDIGRSQNSPALAVGHSKTCCSSETHKHAGMAEHSLEVWFGRDNMISMTARSEDSYPSATGYAGKHTLSAMSTGHLTVNALEGVRHPDEEIQAAPHGLVLLWWSHAAEK